MKLSLTIVAIALVVAPACDLSVDRTEVGGELGEATSALETQAQAQAKNAGASEDVPLSVDEFKELADANGLWDVPLGKDGLPIEAKVEVTPSGVGKLSGTCSITNALVSAVATFGMPASKAAGCYAYYQFAGDNESDCYIKFNGYKKQTSYKFLPLNSCAVTAAAYYDGQLAAYHDSSSNVYLRLDRRWCRYSNCEDGFRIQ